MGDQAFHLEYGGQNIIINKYSPWVGKTLTITRGNDIEPSSIIIRALVHDQDINQRPFYTFEYSITHTGYLRCTFSTAAKVYSPLDEEYIPNTIARAPGATLDYVTETPTAEQYNALLDVLKQTGILI